MTEDKVINKPGNVSECTKTLVDVVVLRILDNGIGNEFPVAEYRLVVVVRREVTVDHLCVVPNTNL